MLELPERSHWMQETTTTMWACHTQTPTCSTAHWHNTHVDTLHGQTLCRQALLLRKGRHLPARTLTLSSDYVAPCPPPPSHDHCAPVSPIHTPCMRSTSLHFTPTIQTNQPTIQPTHQPTR
jgi:hypothetical protein